jgi:predicted RNA binding protein YcfA (HicA-like mRNA interferase family)
VTELEKALARLRARPAVAEFADLRRVLEAHGWTQARQKGSHVSFTKRGHRSLVVPLAGGRKVKRAFVMQILDALELED